MAHGVEYWLTPSPALPAPARVSVEAGRFPTRLLWGLVIDLLWPMECGEKWQCARPKPRPWDTLSVSSCSPGTSAIIVRRLCKEAAAGPRGAKWNPACTLGQALIPPHPSRPCRAQLTTEKKPVVINHWDSGAACFTAYLQQIYTRIALVYIFRQPGSRILTLFPCCLSGSGRERLFLITLYQGAVPRRQVTLHLSLQST